MGIGGGTLSDDLIAYHEARAKGGAGLIVVLGQRLRDALDGVRDLERLGGRAAAPPRRALS